MSSAASGAPDVEVCALQYPGRQERLSEPTLDSIDTLVAAIVSELLADGCFDGRFGLFGHSTGAIVAFEVARRLEGTHGIVPTALFASGRRGPTTRRDEKVHLGGDRALLREVGRLGGTPPELLADEEIQELMLPALRADYKAIETYEFQPGPPLSCPIWALAGDDDPLTTETELAAWRPQTTGRFTLRTFPGHHFYLSDHLPRLSTLIAQALTS
jgi:surfactin synthase thioesterase subunit